MKFREPVFKQREQDYKRAAHDVTSRLFSPEVLASADFPTLLKSAVEPGGNLSGLGIDEARRREIMGAWKAAGMTDYRQALHNLSCGGQFGMTHFQWWTPAVDQGLGEALRSAFQHLVDERTPLAERVDLVRDELHAVATGLLQPDGTRVNVPTRKITLGSLAAILGSLDPSKYTFYPSGVLEAARERYGVPRPEGSAGVQYAAACDFVAEVAGHLRAEGVPVADLLDTESLLWACKGPHHPRDPGHLAPQLANDTLMPLAWAQSLLSLAQRRRQLLFYGPPGTGKTFVARVLAALLGDPDSVELVCFHPSYAYEDFVEGIRPRLTGGELGFRLRKGVLLRMVERAQESPNSRFVLIIDEINRANLPRVLGELLFALENRGPGNTFILPYSDVETSIPENLWLIGTMNTADRSIGLVDAAIRRRFAHVEFAPDTSLLTAWLQKHGASSAIAVTAGARLTALNAELLRLLDADRLIGHTYLMREGLSTESLPGIWEEDIMPVLRDHLFSRLSELPRLRSIFLGKT